MQRELGAADVVRAPFALAPVELEGSTPGGVQHRVLLQHQHAGDARGRVVTAHGRGRLAEPEQRLGGREELRVPQHHGDRHGRAEVVVPLRRRALDERVRLGERVDGLRGVAEAQARVTEQRQRLGPPGQVVDVDHRQQLVGVGDRLLPASLLDERHTARVVQVPQRLEVARAGRHRHGLARRHHGPAREAVEVELVRPVRQQVERPESTRDRDHAAGLAPRCVPVHPEHPGAPDSARAGDAARCIRATRAGRVMAQRRDLPG